MGQRLSFEALRLGLEGFGAFHMLVPMSGKTQSWLLMGVMRKIRKYRPIIP